MAVIGTRTQDSDSKDVLFRSLYQPVIIFDSGTIAADFLLPQFYRARPKHYESRGSQVVEL
jgi:hypothetical protein